MQRNLKKQIFCFVLFSAFLTCSIFTPQETYANASVVQEMSLTEQLQKTRVTLNLKEKSITDVLYEIRKACGIGFVIEPSLNPKDMGVFTLKAENETLENVLNTLLKDTKYTYEVTRTDIFIKAKPVSVKQQQQQAIEIKGKVVTASGNAVVGATVIATSGAGSITDGHGAFALTLSGAEEVTVSCVGYTERVINITKSNDNLVITIVEDEMAVEDVVVTGYANKSKSSFTGAAVAVTRDELQTLGYRDVLSAISTIVPGMELVTNNAAGSDPNVRPEILVRGRSSLEGASNTPTFILDGMEISLDDVFDMDINQIETVTVLKDASAAALYGARAANGVIVFTSKVMTSTPINVSYNLSTQISTPDLTEYNLLNSEQKLEYERLAGVYTANDLQGQYKLDELYDARFKEMRRGVDTYWLSAPLKTDISHNHSLSISGAANNLRYMLNGRYGDQKGMMKGSGRERYGVNFRLSYNINQKVFFVNYTSITGSKSTSSPYGSFGDYTKQNPYDRMYLEDGSINPTMSTGLANPMLEATYGSYSNTNSMTISDNFEFKYNFTNQFMFQTRFNISSTTSNSDAFKSPLSLAFASSAMEDRGSYSTSHGNSGRYELSTSLNYNKIFSPGTMFYVYAGMNMSQDLTDNETYRAVGYYSSEMDHVSFANSYPTDAMPGGSLARSRMLGFSANVNFIYKDRYFVDASFRAEGSSKYGKDDRFSPFVTFGLGWNIHKESFMEGSIFESLRLRANGGVSGNNSFSPYQAVTTYGFSKNYIYKYGIGANPFNIGNPNLQWERTIQYSAGLEFTLRDRVVDGTIDVYNKVTDNLLTDINVAPSTGVSTAKHNLGKVQNTGFEARVNGRLLKTNDIYWQASASATINRNKILEVDDYIKALNEQRNEDSLYDVDPAQIYVEGESTSGLFVVRSAGIDPATGKEVFIKLDGSHTFEYDNLDKVKVGDTSPSILGSINTSFRYKQFTLGATGSYRMGATLYNSTLATRVEGSNPRYNADVRVFESRWKEVGDLTRYKNIADSSLPNQTDRFVEKENMLSISSVNLSYDFSREFCKKIKVRSLRASFYANDVAVFTTVGQERGLDYPFARSFQFSLSLSF